MIGKEARSKLRKSRVAVLGLGALGSVAAELLAHGAAVLLVHLVELVDQLHEAVLGGELDEFTNTYLRLNMGKET